MKDFLKKLIEKRNATREELRTALINAETVEERTSIQESIDELDVEIREAQDRLNELPENDPTTEPDVRGFNPIAACNLDNGGTSAMRNEDPTATTEYRTAFMNFVARGVESPLLTTRASSVTVADDIGAIIPSTIMNEFITEVNKVRGTLYSKVRRLNVRGGIKFPISKLQAKAKWITETTVSEKQKAGEIKTFVEFSYNILEIRVAQTLLSQVVSLPLFEKEIVRIMLEAYLEMMDKQIISGTGQGQMLGITKDSRVTNVVEFTEEEFMDWTQWKKKLFAKVPLAKRGYGEFIFAPSTVEAYLSTMKDKNDRPLFKEATDLSVGNAGGKYFGRNVDLVEPDVIADFETAGNGEVVGVFWVPNDYAINSNLEFGMKRWFDDDLNEYVNKGLTIIDGKILDTSACYLIKKKVAVSK